MRPATVFIVKDQANFKDSSVSKTICNPTINLASEMSKRKQEDVGSSGKEAGEECPPLKKPNNSANKPDLSLYEASRNSLRNNKHISSMIFYDEYYQVRMRQIQATYKVRQAHWSSQGYSYRILLIWDHDRLWGTFDLGFFKGVFLVDPGPGQDHFQADDDYDHEHLNENGSQDEDEQGDEYVHEDNHIYTSESREYPLVWRGTSTQMPHNVFYSCTTVGKIRFGQNEIWGHFEEMLGVGLPEGRCEFHGKTPFGPNLVPISIQEVIDDWNNHGIFCDDEAPRSPSPNVDNPSDEGNESAAATPPSATPREWTKEDQAQFLGPVTGIFNITSDRIEQEWPKMSQKLTIRLHIDDGQKVVWGYFDVSIADGYIYLVQQADGLVPDNTMEFQWRGRESGTGSAINGSGEITITENNTVQGVFRGMAGDVDFKGKRNFMPSRISGRNIDYYRRGWEDYTRGGNSSFYGSRW